MNYEEYDTSWDLEDQSKRSKRAVNCLLAGCKCKAESKPITNKSGVMPVYLVPDTVAELGRRAGTRDMDGTAQPALLMGPSSSNTGRYSNTAAGLSTPTTSASSNHTANQGVFSHLGAVINRQEWSQHYQCSQDRTVLQRCRAILSLQLPVSQQGTQGGATGHGVALCFV